MNKESNPHLYQASEMLCLSSFKQFQERMGKAKLCSKQLTTETNATIRSLIIHQLHVGNDTEGTSMNISLA